MYFYRSILDEELNMAQYQQKFKTLLFFEEVQMEVDIRKYDMEDVSLRPYSSNSRLLLLEVSANISCILRLGFLPFSPVLENLLLDIFS